MDSFLQDVAHFGGLVQHAPKLLRELLNKSSATSADRLVMAVRDWYSGLTRYDLASIQTTGSLSDSRLSELARAAGLPDDMPNVPLQVFHLYCENTRRASLDPPEYQFTDEETVFLLTRGVNSIQDYFIIKDHGINHWGGDATGTIGAVLLHVEDFAVQACYQYLLARGAYYHSFADVLARAKQENWPNCKEVADNVTGWLEMYQNQKNVRS
jgi:hypothetical protein